MKNRAGFLKLGNVKIRKIKLQNSKDRNDVMSADTKKINVFHAFAYRKNKKEIRDTSRI